MSTNGTFRAFYAVPFQAAEARSLVAETGRAIGGARGWRVTPASRIHLTLKFLGETPAALVPDLTGALEEAVEGMAPFPLTLSGWLPLPGALTVGVSDPTGSLPRLATGLEARAEALGFRAERKPFVPHVTVARNRVRTVPPAAPSRWEHRSVETTVDRIVLMTSTLRPGGPTYAVVAEARLAETSALRTADPRRMS